MIRGLELIALDGLHGIEFGSPSSVITSGEVFPADGGLLSQFKAFDSSPWERAGISTTVVADATTAPDGTSTADRIVPSTSNETQRVQQPITFSAGQYTASVYGAPNGYNFIGIRIWQGDSNWLRSEYNVSTGAVTQTLQGTNNIFSSISSSIVGSANGFYRVILTFNTSVSNAGNVAIHISNTGTPTLSVHGEENWTGNGTSAAYLSMARLISGGSP